METKNPKQKFDQIIKTNKRIATILKTIRISIGLSFGALMVFTYFIKINSLFIETLKGIIEANRYLLVLQFIIFIAIWIIERWLRTRRKNLLNVEHKIFFTEEPCLTFLLKESTYIKNNKHLIFLMLKKFKENMDPEWVKVVEVHRAYNASKRELNCIPSEYINRDLSYNLIKYYNLEEFMQNFLCNIPKERILSCKEWRNPCIYNQDPLFKQKIKKVILENQSLAIKDYVMVERIYFHEDYVFAKEIIASLFKQIELKKYLFMFLICPQKKGFQKFVDVIIERIIEENKREESGQIKYWAEIYSKDFPMLKEIFE